MLSSQQWTDSNSSYTTLGASATSNIPSQENNGKYVFIKG